MRKRMAKLVARSAALLSAGVLFQTAGCDPGAIVAGLTSSIVNTVISDLVFGAFNVIGP